MSILSTIPIYLLSNTIALNRILNGELGKSGNFGDNFWEGVAHAAFMHRDSTRPDHVFKKRWEAMKEAAKTKEQPDLLDALRLVGEEYMKKENGLLYIKQGEPFIRWQNLRSRMTTLPIKTYFLYYNKLQPSCGLAHPYEPHLSDHIRHEGLHELHLHVNECATPDDCWLYFLYHVKEFVDVEYQKFTHGSLKQLYMSIDPELTPTRVANHITLASILRGAILDILDSNVTDKKSQEEAVIEAKTAFMRLIDYQDLFMEHPTRVSLHRDMNGRLHEEVNMWYRAFQHLNDPRFEYKRHLTEMLHLYLLIQNEFIQLYHHNERNRGFEAFHRVADQDRPFVSNRGYYHTVINRLITATRAREKNCIELRLSPRSIQRCKSRILNIWREVWRNQQKKQLIQMGGNPHTGTGDKPPRLILVAHFIKKPCNSQTKKADYIAPELYAAESEKYLREAASFANKAHDILKEGALSLGIDAAGDELAAPPEVFAPAFRLFSRRTHLHHKTYHCGEDFHHLLSGIRTVYEAIEFLDLSKGNRVGHATAIGIEPKKWLDSMPTKLFIPRWEWFLNLIFARRFLKEPFEIHKVEARLATEASILFGTPTPIELNLHALDILFDARKLSSRYMSDSLFICTEDGIEEQKLYERFKKMHSETGLRLYERWRNDPDVRKRQNELIEIEADFLDKGHLQQLQQEIQHKLAKKGIAVEALLTSNLRISQYEDVGQHHILRWLKVGEHAIPGDADLNVCLGSDDPGIFVTDIKNEYYHLFNILVKETDSTDKAMSYIRRIHDTGRIYSFSSLPGTHPDSELQENLSSLFRSLPPTIVPRLFDVLNDD